MFGICGPAVAIQHGTDARALQDLHIPTGEAFVQKAQLPFGGRAVATELEHPRRFGALRQRNDLRREIDGAEQDALPNPVTTSVAGTRGPMSAVKMPSACVFLVVSAICEARKSLMGSPGCLAG